MASIKNLLQEANDFFSNKQYDKALFLYSQVCSSDPMNLEYQIYSILCDIGFENDEKAQSLFEYFSIAKDVNFEEAAKYVQDVINAYDGDHEKMMNILQDISSTSVESLNAIDYKDFLSLVESRGSFKQAYQDIMFSTKVAITSKEDLIDFIEKLIENNFNKTAYSYLDGFNEYFSYDQDLIRLYEKLEGKLIENNS